MSFLQTINEALKSGADPNQSKLVKVEVPLLDVPKWIENQQAGRESKFKKTPDEHLAMDKVDGFFFHYQPVDNILYTSNGSFNFIVDIRPRSRLGNSYWRSAPHSYDLSRIEPANYKTNDLNFRVDKKAKKIALEKDWGGSKGTSIVGGTIKNPENVRDALKAAVKHFPELDKYTFTIAKKKVSEYTKGGVDALATGGTMTAYFTALGDEMKEFLKNGLDDKSAPNAKADNYKVQIHFDKKEAARDAKDLSDSNRMYHVTALAQFTFSDPDLLEESYGGRFKISDGKKVPAKDIKLLKASFKEYFDKSWQPTQPLAIREEPIFKTWRRGSNFQHIFIAQSEEEYKRFRGQLQPEKYTKSGRKKGRDTVWTWHKSYGDEYPPIGMILKSGVGVLMFPPTSTEADVKKFMAERWWESRDLKGEIPYQLKDEDYMKDIGYQVYYHHKFPEPVNYIMMKSAFDKKSSWNDPAGDMMKALGREVYRSNEDD